MDISEDVQYIYVFASLSSLTLHQKRRGNNLQGIENGCALQQTNVTDSSTSYVTDI